MNNKSYMWYCACARAQACVTYTHGPRAARARNTCKLLARRGARKPADSQTRASLRATLQQCRLSTLQCLALSASPTKKLQPGGTVWLLWLEAPRRQPAPVVQLQERLLLVRAQESPHAPRGLGGH